MSYARKGTDSDVYVFHDGAAWHCHGCALGGAPCIDTDTEEVVALRTERTPAAMLAHLEEHVRVGHRVPTSALDRLREEARTEK